MSPGAHFFAGWVLANAANLTRRDRALITVAALAPDIDGIGIIPELLTRDSQHPLYWYSLYHHSLHTLWFAVAVAVLVALFARTRVSGALLAFTAVHVHYLQDFVGSAGRDGTIWTIPYFHPFTPAEYSWSGQWALNSWQNLTVTLALLGISIAIIFINHRSPVELFSPKIDVGVVEVFERWKTRAQRSVRA